MKNTPNGLKLSTETIKAAYVACNGKLMGVADTFQVDRTTLWRRMKRDPELQQFIDEYNAGKICARLDIAETNLDTALEAGERWATVYVLDKQGAERGFVDRRWLESNVNNSGALTVNVVYEDSILDESDGTS